VVFLYAATEGKTLIDYLYTKNTTMDKYDSILFDLDGTLWDAAEATAKGWNKALAAMDFPDLRVTADEIRGVCGLPFSECITTLFKHLDEADCKALGPRLDEEEKRSIEAVGGIVYADVVEGLDKLSSSYSLYLISNCQSWYLKAFWDQYPVKPLFKGQDCYGDSGVDKSEMIRALVKKYSLKKSIYVGDTAGDQESSRNGGIAFGHAAYGFGVAEGASPVFNNFHQLIDYFLG
jgi:phosphoglycolate phosphatase